MLGRFAVWAEPGREAVAEKHRRDVDRDPFALLRPKMQDHAERVAPRLPVRPRMRPLCRSHDEAGGGRRPRRDFAFAWRDGSEAPGDRGALPALARSYFRKVSEIGGKIEVEGDVRRHEAVVRDENVLMQTAADKVVDLDLNSFGDDFAPRRIAVARRGCSPARPASAKDDSARSYAVRRSRRRPASPPCPRTRGRSGKGIESDESNSRPSTRRSDLAGSRRACARRSEP